MKKVFVKWGYTDDYGWAEEADAKVEWFEAEEEAQAFVDKMIAGNGGYFKLWKIKAANYEDYERMLELSKELAKLKKMF